MEGNTVAIAVYRPKITIVIKSQDGDKMYFKAPKEKRMRELLKIYCKEKNFLYHEMSFIHDGNRIQPSLNPVQLGIEDGDEIAAMRYQSGGGNPAAFA